ncbi:uncharacterized protein LOC117168144 [Belonocnema kinseyi]|uniref:uncharacterized protein LOC117168144 n=1 Tax=Belonocnema kinseyi TaxID=2817044 RepID=UPI00143D665C|nr:uncharacterized protein LOC117168144 [Belonocnema kinseyi]
MAQPGFFRNFGNLTTEGHKFESTNPRLTQATNSINSFDSISQDKFQCTYFRSRSSKTTEMKSSVPWLGNTAASDISDPYSDSDSEADNRRNVARWLESLPTNEDWYDIEDDLPNRQGDFEKGTHSDLETPSKNTKKEEFDVLQPSASFKNDTPSSSMDQKSTKKKVTRSKGSKHKISPGKIKSGKLKVHFKEIPTEIRSANSKYHKLSVGRDGQLCNRFESLEETKNTDSKDLSTSDEGNEEKAKLRKFPYNLRSLDSRKVGEMIESRMSDSDEKTSRCQRSCSIRNQEYQKKMSGVDLANGGARRHQVEDLKPSRKLKSPFTKQASSSKTPGLFAGTPCTSSYKLNELEEAKENVQQVDRGRGNQNYIDRTGIVKSKLARNKKLLKTVKDLVNVIDSNADPVYKILKKERRTLKNPSKNIPPLINSKLEEKLDKSMEVALKKYKRTHGTWEATVKKQSIDHLEEPPRKKKKRPVF